MATDRLGPKPIPTLNTAILDELFEGDMALSVKQANLLLANTNGRKKRMVQLSGQDSDYVTYWPKNKPICYTINSSIGRYSWFRAKNTR